MFGAWGLGPTIRGFGFRAQGSGFKAVGLRSRRTSGTAGIPGVMG